MTTAEAQKIATQDTPAHVMSATERRAAGVLASIFGLRMLGLFLLLPVLAVYAPQYPDYSGLMVGLAIGAYGLTQALLQIPFGMLSDRIGRRTVIVAGLLLFAAGSVVAALADSLWGVVIGRALQGTGAIAAAVLALAADLSREQTRAKVMATIGMCIGLAFALALVGGPVLAAWIGLRGLFWVTAGAALLAVLLLFLLPQVTTGYAKRDALPVWRELGGLLRAPQLLRLNLGVFILHACLTAWFIALPTGLEQAGLPLAQHAWLYLPTLAGSIAVMVPLLIMAAKRQAHVALFRVAIGLILLAVAGVAAIGSLLPTHWWVFAVALWLFFAGFNFLEASLPSLLTRLAPAGSKGSASGIFATFQFSGAFIGGVLGGLVSEHFGASSIGLFCMLLLVCWGCLTWGMTVSSPFQNISVQLPTLAREQVNQLAAQLSQLAGIEEVRMVSAERMAYLKVNQSEYDAAAVHALIAGSAAK